MIFGRIRFGDDLLSLSSDDFFGFILDDHHGDERDREEDEGDEDEVAGFHGLGW